jgi:hypothetical protein
MKGMSEQREYDPVDGPKHYRWLNGLEVIDITEQLNFNLGNVIKYTLRSAHKGKRLEDLKKAVWYIQREISRIEKFEQAEEMKELPVTDIKIDGLISSPDTKVYVTGYVSAPPGEKWVVTNTAGLSVAPINQDARRAHFLGYHKAYKDKNCIDCNPFSTIKTFTTEKERDLFENDLVRHKMEGHTLEDSCRKDCRACNL